MHVEKQLIFWKTSGDRNLKTAQDLYKTKHYDACLFFCHLALEKYLKGLVVLSTKQFAPYIHDLAKLARLAALDFTDKTMSDLRTITTFNIAGRYDDVKLNFYKQCTPVFTKKYLLVSIKLCRDLVKKYPKL